MQGIPLCDAIATDAATRTAALFGLHGGHVNVTDGRYVYMRAPANPENKPLYNYTLMPTHMRARFSVDELAQAKLCNPFAFTKGCPTLQVPAQAWSHKHPYQTMLFDLHQDPDQEHPIQDAAVERHMIEHLQRLIRENDAPPDQFERLGLAH
jgi:hypothetical protein